jgi:signal peptidase II
MNNPIASFAPIRRHIALFAAVLAADQATKYWARLRFSLPGGEPDYVASISVIGEWLHFRLVYNYGAAFGMKPQNIVPFLHPIVFFVLFSIAAITFLGFYYRRLGADERAARLGILLILAGAVGNLIDRVALHRVTDFIDAGIPGFSPRWPVFNIADSSVCVGIALLLIPPFFARRVQPRAGKSAPPESPPANAAVPPGAP